MPVDWDVPNEWLNNYLHETPRYDRRLVTEALDQINAQWQPLLRRERRRHREEQAMPTLTVRSNDTEVHHATFKREYAIKDVRGGRGRLGGRYNDRLEAEHIRDRYNRESLIGDQWGRNEGEYVLERRFVVEFDDDFNRAPGLRRYRDLLAAVLSHRELHLPPHIGPDDFVRVYVVGAYAQNVFAGNGREFQARMTTNRWNEARDYRDRLVHENNTYNYGEEYTIRLRLRTLFRQTPDPFATEPPRRRRITDGVYAVAA